MNLLSETLDILLEYKKSPSDVRFVSYYSGTTPFHCSWEDFARVASFAYHDGFGATEIEITLKIVGDDWWLERGEYDGSEWWEFKTLPLAKGSYQPPASDDLRDPWRRSK